MSKFYYPDGTEIKKKEDFIKFYSQVYYYRNKNKDLEDRIDGLLRRDTLTRKDIVAILEWKIGGTSDGEVVKNRNGSIDVGELIHRYDLQSESFNKRVLYKENAQETLAFLTSQKGIGPVYAITLLYFISKGEWPIYDKYAKMALSAILDPKERKPRDVVKHKELPQKDSKAFSNIMCQDMEEYKGQIEAAFGMDEYRKSRDIDRALWAYGHLFNPK